MSGALVIQTSFLGDVILTTPLIAELAKRSAVDVLTTPLGATALDVHTIIPYDKRGTYGSALGLWATVKEIRSRRPYQAVYLAQGSYRSGMLAMMTTAQERIGFASSTGRALYTRQVPYRPEKHHAERVWSLAMSDCADPPTREQIRPRLYPSDEDRQMIDGLFRRSGMGMEPFVALAPGSAWGTKRWPYYAELARELSGDARVVVLGSADDAPLAAAIVAAVPDAVNATGRLSLLASAELIGRCATLVTNDSAPMHLASAMGTPTVALFGPTVPEFGFGPLAPRASVVGHDTLPCRPCDRHGPQRCPLGHHDCMRQLPPALVAERARALLLNPDVLA